MRVGARFLRLIVAVAIVVGLVPASAFGVSEAIDITAFTVSPIAEQPYTGSAVEPPVTVMDGGTTLTPGTDYAVAYSDNVNPGPNATALITGAGAYTGTITAKFTIGAIPIVDISAGSIDSIPTQVFSGAEIKPLITVRVAGTALVPDVDYTVEYSDNTGVGLAAVAAHGIGAYEGTLAATFSITATPPTPGNVLNFAVLDTIIALGDAVDPALYTTQSYARMKVQLDAAKALRLALTGLTALDMNQTRVNDAARILCLEYDALVLRYGPDAAVVVHATGASLWTVSADSSATVAPVLQGDSFSARLDYEIPDAWWYYVLGRGYLRAMDIFESPAAGVGDPYDVVCLNDPVTVYAHPFTWANAVTSLPQRTSLTVRTVSDGWVVTTWDASGATVYGYLRTGDVKPVDGEYPPLGSEANPAPTTDPVLPDPNAADPNEVNPETRPSTSPAFGVGGTGPNPLGLMPASWWPGQTTTGINRFERFWVKFPQNISDPADSAINVTKFKLTKADGTPVPARVYTYDRNLYPDARRAMFLEPLAPLDWGTRYVLSVLPGIKARNGQVSTVTVLIPFSTEIYPFARGEGAAPASAVSPTGQGITFGTAFGAPAIAAGTAAPAGGGGASASDKSAGSAAKRVVAVSTITKPGEAGVAGQIAAAGLGEVGEGDSRVVPMATTDAAAALGSTPQAPGGMAPLWPGIVAGALAAFALVFGAYLYFRRRVMAGEDLGNAA